MKAIINNGEIILIKNNKESFDKIEKMANKIITIDCGFHGLVHAAADENYIHLTCTPDFNQAQALKELYKEAKAAI